ncbi:MAG: hypothetical protein GF331_08365, partial [Chitinivibrionales bacterium]|nr:hypothetical protein [Chitinivibrionales bacterium]
GVTTWSPTPTSSYFEGVLDEVRVENVARDSLWVKYSYENQRPDQDLQVTDLRLLEPVFDGALANKPNDFADDTTFITVKQGDRPWADTISHAMMRFDLRDAEHLSDMGWRLESAQLRFGLRDVETPSRYDSIAVGVASGDRLLPYQLKDGYRAWREDGSTRNGGEVITMDSTTYSQGIGGQPCSDGEWSWLIYDLRSEMQRLGIDSLPDSITGYLGHQDSSTSVDVYIKTSTNDTMPDTAAWKSNGTGVAEQVHVSSAATNQYSSVDLSSVNWLFLGLRSSTGDTTDHGVLAELRIHLPVPKNTEMVFFQVRSDSVDTAGMDFIHRAPGVLWSHAAVDGEASVDSADGIGTEDLVSGYWNRYKRRYRARSPLGVATVQGRRYGVSDTLSYYLGVIGENRVLPADITEGYYDFVEDESTDENNAITIDSVYYPYGIGGAPQDGAGAYASMVFDLRSESERLEYGELLAIAGTVAQQDGSDSLEAYAKTSTSTSEPSQSDWENTQNGVVTQAAKTASQESVAFTVANASDIKWLWLGTRTTDGSASDAHAVWADLRLKTAAEASGTMALQTQGVGRAVATALRSAGNGGDSTEAMFTVLGALLDSGTVRIHSSRSQRTAMRPSLALQFSDSRTMLSWDGRDSSLSLPADSQMSLAGSPSVGDGRYDEVVRFHGAGQYAAVCDSGVIDYQQGMLSMWYQKTSGAGNASGAVLVARDTEDSTYFKLVRNGVSDTLFFLYGDTTGDSAGSNMMIWDFVSRYIEEIDTVSDDTTWGYDTLANPFDANQHFVQLTWDQPKGHFRLTIDGKHGVIRKAISAPSNSTGWASDSLIFGEGCDGYIEQLVIRSRSGAPLPLVVAELGVDTVAGYLPYVQPAFNDSVDCIVIAPRDELMRGILDEYAMRNNSIGIRTQVVDIGRIEQYYAGADVAERIRNFLKNAWHRWSPTYVVLGGSTDHIPAREVAFETRNGHAVATDRYYACLEGTWNDDADAYFAEPEDSTDLTAELVVGRFPANDWRELRTMVNKSTMAMGLPPYGNQCLGNTEEVLISGVQMFNKFGDVTDGKYYGEQLREIIEQGAYTAAAGTLSVRTYYPMDDTTAPDSMVKAFIDTLHPLPGLWLHYGHGGFQAIQVDTANTYFEYSRALRDTALQHLSRLTHVRVVGCETAGQQKLSMARALLTNPYGGAVSYLGAGEYSYPVIESRLLEEEMKALADSSLFTWGQIHRWAANKVLHESSSWDLTRWVVLSRNYLGDPVLPARSRALTAADSLDISVSPGSVTSREGTLTVTVTSSSKPVEGATVGMISASLELAGDTTAYRVLEDLAFAHGVTNRKGVVQLPYTISYEDTLVVTALHADHQPQRVPVDVTFAQDEPASVAMRVYDTEHIQAYPWPEPEDTLAANNVVEPGDHLQMIVRFTGRDEQDSVRITNVVFEPDTVGTGILLEPDSICDGSCSDELKRVGSNGDIMEYIAYRYLKRCPPGGHDLRIKITFTDTLTSGARTDSAYVTVPVSGPAIQPVMAYLNAEGESHFPPQDGDSVTVQVLLGNASPASALDVQCRLLEESGFVQAQADWLVTDTVEVVPGGGSNTALYITYKIVNGYDADTDGIIPARLVVSGRNIPTDTMKVDLNPLVLDTFAFQKNKVALDYRNGLYLRWEPTRFDSAGNRKSDLLGYAVTRNVLGSDSTVLLTQTAITASNFFYDNLPAEDTTYEYLVWVVDSSYNTVQWAAATASKRWNEGLRRNFPVFANNLDLAPAIAGDHDRDGLGEIITANPQPIGFRADGQSAGDGVPELYDGAGLHNNTVLAQVFADLNKDGIDEGIFFGYDRLVVKDFGNETLTQLPTGGSFYHMD